MRHIIGIMGVLAATVLLVVSAAMNWRFGYSLGKSDLDGLIYGSASAAADCLKALIPFFFFAALRNKVWSQAIAAALVGTVCAAYSLTSALGHAALNRFDSTGQRAVAAQKYQDLRTDLQRTKERLSSLPEHRPLGLIESEIQTTRNERLWSWTNGCTEVMGKTVRDYCKTYNSLMGELSAAKEADLLGSKIEGLSSQLASEQSSSAMSEADPQATVMAKLTGLPIETIQMALTVFIALLLEVGSCFGMYVAVSQWKLYGQEVTTTNAENVKVLPTKESEETFAGSLLQENSQTTNSLQVLKAQEVSSPKSPRRSVEANENNLSATVVHRLVPVINDVARFYTECVQTQDGSTLNAREVYEFYVEWCKKKEKASLSSVLFSRQFVTLGVKKSKKAGKNIYQDIGLQPHAQLVIDPKITSFKTKVA